MSLSMKFPAIFVVASMVCSASLIQNANCEDDKFWVSHDWLQIVVQSGLKNETYYFNNDSNRRCYTFKVAGKWQPSSQSISLLEIRESESEERVSSSSTINLTTWEGSLAGVYIYSPSELAGHEGPDPISKAAAMHIHGIEQRFGTKKIIEELNDFECSWPNAKIWAADWSVLLNEETTEMFNKKAFIGIDLDSVAQVSFWKPDNPNWNDDVKDLIKTFKINKSPECFLPYIRENFDAVIGQLATGLVAFRKSDYSTALRILKPLAEEGYKQAQAALGFIHSEGIGVDANDHEAIHWLKLAANQGEPMAQFNLGVYYADGRGTTQSYSEAEKWYLASAEQNNPNAQFNLGLLYWLGEGMTQNNEEAFKWFSRAAEQNLPAAQYNLGMFYEKGIVVSKNDSKAANLYLLSAAAGLPPAQMRIGYKYITGEGVQRDLVEAFAWLHIASQSDSDGIKRRDWVGQQLSFMEKRRAKKRAEELMQMIIQ